MSTTTSTVTINAAFLQEIKEDNRELHYLQKQADEFLLDGRHVRWPSKRTVDLLSKLRDQLAMHFALEESFGYFDDAVEAAPRLSDQAEALRCEHETLFREICNVVESAEKCLYHESPAAESDKISAQYHHFRHAFARHESQENELILLAFDDDIGVGD